MKPWYKDPPPCPAGALGQQLWGRESFKVEPTPGCTYGESMMGRKLTVFYRDGGRMDIVGEGITAGGVHMDIAAADYNPNWYGWWRSSSNMSRWASRWFLEVESVEYRQVDTITLEECYRAGILLPVVETDDPTKRKMVIPITGGKDCPLSCWPSEYYPKRDDLHADDLTEEDVMRALFASEWDQWQRKRFPWTSSPWAWRVTVNISPGNKTDREIRAEA
jgi:hypothetical protein